MFSSSWYVCSNEHVKYLYCGFVDLLAAGLQHFFASLKTIEALYVRKSTKPQYKYFTCSLELRYHELENILITYFILGSFV